MQIVPLPPWVVHSMNHKTEIESKWTLQLLHRLELLFRRLSELSWLSSLNADPSGTPGTAGKGAAGGEGGAGPPGEKPPGGEPGEDWVLGEDAGAQR